MRFLALAALLALAGCSKGENPAVREEAVRRERYSHALLIDGGADAIRVTSTDDIHFEDGFSLIEFDPAENYKSHAFRWMGRRGHVRLHNRDNVPMRLKFVGWVNQQVVHTRPHLTAYLDGQYLLTVELDDKGFFFYENTVDPWLMRGRQWLDLVIECSGVGFHWADPPELKVVTLFDFAWEKR